MTRSVDRKACCLCRMFVAMFRVVTFGLFIVGMGAVSAGQEVTPSPPPTLTPPSVVNLTLELEARSPAVLDSVVHFTARLKNQKGESADWPDFLYEWTDTAHHNVSSTSDDFNSTFVQTYHDPLLAGQYLMTVVVYKQPNRSVTNQSTAPNIITYGNVRFDLTENLNGGIDFYQDLDYQRDASVFATGKVLHMRCHVSDVFSKRQNPRTKYKWRLPKLPVITSMQPTFNVTEMSTGNATYGVTVVTEFDLPASGSSGKVGFLFPPAPVTKTRSGTFKKLLVFKAPLQDVRVHTDRSVAVGGVLHVNVSATGSAPTSICWEVTNKKNFTCKPNNFTDTTQHTLNISISADGWQSVQFMVYNDVSRQKGKFRVYVYNPGDLNVPALTIPLVFVAFGLIVVLVGSSYMVRLRKRAHIETADFDFHPSLSQRTAKDVVLGILAKVKQVFTERDHAQWQKQTTNQDWTSSGESSTMPSL